MLGFSYISVPLYQLYCQSFGGNPFLQNTETNFKSLQDNVTQLTNSDTKIKPIHSTNIEYQPKQINIHFNADTSDNLPWNFKPYINKIRIYPGDTGLSFYKAENNTNEAISGISTYFVSPPKVGIYFNKIQCFCFEEQRLKAHESVEMPILFFIDPEFSKDPKMADVTDIVLSYTFYKFN